LKVSQFIDYNTSPSVGKFGWFIWLMMVNCTYSSVVGKHIRLFLEK